MDFPILLIKLVEVAAKSHDEDYRNDKENGKKDYGYDGHCGEAFGFNGEHFKVDQGANDHYHERLVQKSDERFPVERPVYLFRKNLAAVPAKTTKFQKRTDYH